MTNPTNKRTHEQFVSGLRGDIQLLDRYVNTDTKVRYQCSHGIYSARPWQLLKFKHCCRQGYYDSKGPIKSLHDWTQEIVQQYGSRFDTSNLSLVTDKFLNLRCIEHNVIFDNWIDAFRKGHISCNECKKRNWKHQWHGKKSRGSYVSKAETQWLNEIGIASRQVWLDDVQYRVDGYDADTKTVYLYHGRFWHGCPETFKPSDVHPVVGLTMGELYEKTLNREAEIRNAGYNLVVKWGT